jgi:hypothetical protein
VQQWGHPTVAGGPHAIRPAPPAACDSNCCHRAHRFTDFADWFRQRFHTSMNARKHPEVLKVVNTEVDGLLTHVGAERGE